jgi:hypothetical protein
MRIVVASPPKSGNHWIKCLLGEIYGLRQIGAKQKLRGGRDAENRWEAVGEFPDGTIMHTHSRFSRKLADAIDRTPAHLVTIVRDPYDAFVSLYHWTQERVERDLDDRTDRRRHQLAGKPLDHPDAVRFVADEFGANIASANGWLHSGRAVVVRYEDLHTDPLAALARVTDAIEPAAPGRIAAAVETCRAENMRQQSAKMQWHVRSAKVGDSRQKLGEAHLAAFRTHHAAAIRSLGYEVR